MFRYFKDFFRVTPPFYLIVGWWRSYQDRKEIRRWEKSHNASPPPQAIKRAIVQKYSEEFSINVLVETGTSYGDMIWGVRNLFSKIYSIELDKYLYELARKRFHRFNHIEIYQGDSSIVLPKILSNLQDRCIFWLDAHYSGGVTAKADLETPIIKEIEVILEHPIKNHVILIDDAQYFDGRNDYPKLAELEKYVLGRRPDLAFHVNDDIIRITS